MMNTPLADTTDTIDTIDTTVSAVELAAETGMPLRTIYRLVNKGRIPFEDRTQPWHEPGVKRIRFDVAAVKAALGMRRSGR